MNTHSGKPENTPATEQEFPIPGNGGGQVKAETVVQNRAREDEVDEDGDAS